MSVLTAVVTVLILSISACDVIGGEDFPLKGTNVAITDIAGNWTASRALFFVQTTGQGSQIDLIAEGGTVDLVIQDDGRFILTFGDATGGTSETPGQLGFDEEWLVVASDESPDDPDYFSVNFTNDILNISGPGEFDANDDSLLDPGTFEFFFDRN